MIERDADYEVTYGDAMLDEMVKIGGIGSAIKQFSRKASPGLSQAGIGRLAGTGIGAGLGAAGGAATNEDDRVGGALRGALYGGAAGLAGGQLATGMGRRQVKHIGQRQLHGMTGYMPRTKAQKARGVSVFGKGLSKDERVGALKQIGMDVGERGDRGKAVQKALESQSITKSLPKSWRERLAKAEVSGAEARREAAEKGLTSIPGVVKGMAKNPIKTLKTGFVSQGPVGMALAATPMATTVPGLVSGEGLGEGYSGPGGAGKLIGENIGYTALGALPMAPMMVGGQLAAKAGELAHRGIKGVVNKGQQAGKVTHD